jgi:hypothetical protein
MAESQQLKALENLKDQLSQKVVGQQKAVERIIPCVQMYLAGLSPFGRPAGVFSASWSDWNWKDENRRGAGGNFAWKRPQSRASGLR